MTLASLHQVLARRMLPSVCCSCQGRSLLTLLCLGVTRGVRPTRTKPTPAPHTLHEPRWPLGQVVSTGGCGAGGQELGFAPCLLATFLAGKALPAPPCARSSPSCSPYLLPTLSFPHGDGFWRRPLWRGDLGEGTRHGGGGGGGGNNAPGACLHLRCFGLCCCSLPSSVVRGSVPLPVLLSCCPSARTVPSDTWPVYVSPPLICHASSGSCHHHLRLAGRPRNPEPSHAHPLPWTIPISVAARGCGWH